MKLSSIHRTLFLAMALGLSGGTGGSFETFGTLDHLWVEGTTGTKRDTMDTRNLRKMQNSKNVRNLGNDNSERRFQSIGDAYGLFSDDNVNVGNVGNVGNIENADNVENSGNGTSGENSGGNEGNPFFNSCETLIAIADMPDPEWNRWNRDLSVFDQVNVDNGNGKDDHPSENDDNESFLCENSQGLSMELTGTLEQMTELRNMLRTGELVSGEYTLDLDGMGVDGAGLEMGHMDQNGESGENGESGSSDGNGGEMQLILPPGKVAIKKIESANEPATVGRNLRTNHPNHQNHPSHRNHRNLAILEGQRRVLVVKVTDSDGLSHADSPETISDNVFGTYGDPVNLRTQLQACSMGKLNMTYDYNDYDSPGPPSGIAPSWINQLSAPGVLEVDIPTSLNSPKGRIRNNITLAVMDKLGLESLPGPFDHVMYVLKECQMECGWAAYAYINSWNSVYQKKYYSYTGVQIHELGHNFNLAHSGGLDGKTYTDHTCLMGNPLYSDDVGRMCFNPAKNYQISKGGAGSNDPSQTTFWYDELPTDILQWEPTSTNPIWSGQLIGIADYHHPFKNNRPIIVKIESGTDDNDLFVGFNRATGVNAENDEADDEVTVVTSGKNGLGYSQSFLKATLLEGEEYVAVDFKGEGLDLRIGVVEISEGEDPWYARVSMKYGDVQTASPTRSPIDDGTVAPTGSPTPEPTQSPMNLPLLATFDPTMGIPLCNQDASACDSGDTLLAGRGSINAGPGTNIGPEENSPNSMGDCADGNSGTYGTDESLDRIVIRSVSTENPILTVGEPAVIEASVHAWSDGSNDYVEFYYSIDANNLDWIHTGTKQPSSAGGFQTVTSDPFILEEGAAVQAVRVVFMYTTTYLEDSICPGGAYDDVDDLAFTVVMSGAEEPTRTPTTRPTSPASTSPTKAPTASPTISPTSQPTTSPTRAPTQQPISTATCLARNSSCPPNPEDCCSGSCYGWWWWRCS